MHHMSSDASRLPDSRRWLCTCPTGVSCTPSFSLQPPLIGHQRLPSLPLTSTRDSFPVFCFAPRSIAERAPAFVTSTLSAATSSRHGDGEDQVRTAHAGCQLRRKPTRVYNGPKIYRVLLGSDCEVKALFIASGTMTAFRRRCVQYLAWAVPSMCRHRISSTLIGIDTHSLLRHEALRRRRYPALLALRVASSCPALRVSIFISEV